MGNKKESWMEMCVRPTEKEEENQMMNVMAGVDGVFACRSSIYILSTRMLSGGSSFFLIVHLNSNETCEWMVILLFFFHK